MGRFKQNDAVTIKEKGYLWTGHRYTHQTSQGTYGSDFAV